MVAAKLLAEAAARSGFHSQSFASYGALRRGGKVESYVRVSDEEVPLRCKMYTPDYLVIMDESLVKDADTLSGLKKNGKVLINTAKRREDFSSLQPFQVFTVDAYRIANQKGLVIPGGMPVINTTLLGAVAGIIAEISLDHLVEVIKAGTPRPEKNAECAAEGYRQVTASAPRGVRPDGERDKTPQIPVRRWPVYDPEKMERCHRCQVCYISCPGLAITFEGDPLQFSVIRERCTACGICIEECPRKAISWGGQGNDQGHHRK